MEGSFIVAVGEVDGVVDQLDADIWIFRTHLVEALRHRFGDADFAGALGAEDAEGNDGGIVETREGFRFLIGVFDGAEFGELDETAVRQGDRRIGEFRHVAGVAENADRLLAARHLAASGAEVDVGSVQLLVHAGGSDAVGVQLVGVELDADFTFGTAIAVHAADAGLTLEGALDRIVDEPGEFLERHVRRGDGKGLDRLAFDIDLGDDRFLDIGRKIAADAVDRVLGVLDRLLRRHFHAEHHVGLRLTVGDRGLDFVDAVDRGDGVFDLLGHLHFEFGRRSAALRHVDRDERHVDVREARDRQLVEGLNTDKKQQREKQQRRYGISDRPG